MYGQAFGIDHVACPAGVPASCRHPSDYWFNALFVLNSEKVYQTASVVQKCMFALEMTFLQKRNHRISLSRVVHAILYNILPLAFSARNVFHEQGSGCHF